MSELGYKISEYIELSKRDGRLILQCVKCGRILCSADEHWKDRVPRVDSPVSKAGPRRSSSGLFKMREYICPNCATTLDVEVAQDGDAPLYDVVDYRTIAQESLE